MMNEYDMKTRGACGCPPERLPTWSGASPDSPARTLDLSRPLFRASFDVPVGELLQALPKVKGSPLASTLDTTGLTSLFLSQQIPTQPADFFASTPIYTEAADLLQVSLGASTDQAFAASRMGYVVPALKIDTAAAAWSAAGNPSASRLQIAVSSLCAWVDYYLGHGTGAEGPPAFAGVVEYANKWSRLFNDGASDDPIDVETAARRVLTAVRPRERGAGAGPDCLVGNDRMVRTLMASASGSTGTSGWRPDARTGLTVYHYQGLPVYRCNLPNKDAGELTLGYLAAANLGRDGLHLVHGYGTAETLGVQIDEERVASQQAQVRYVVHGAWTLLAFDPNALACISKVTYVAEP